MTVLRLEELPWPGEELTARVTTGVNRESFFESGRQTVADIEAGLASIGRRMTDYSRILDFGCGCGRVLLWLRDLAGSAELYGVDIDERMVEWDREHIPWATVTVSLPMPPLDFPDGFFDLVYCHSVFTHVPEDMQDAWLAELRRVTKPGGNLFLTVHGEHAFAKYELEAQPVGDPAPMRNILSSKGICYIADDCFVGSSHPDFYHSTYHAPWYVFSHWAKWLTVKAYLPRRALGFQDGIVFERPAGGAEHTPIPPTLGKDTVETGISPLPPPHEHATPPPAIDELRSLSAGPDPGSASRYGPVARAARRGVMRVIRHYANHQGRFAAGVVGAVESLTERVVANERDIRELRRWTVVPNVSVFETVVRLRATIQQLGDRMNRLERDVFGSMEELEERVAPKPGRQRASLPRSKSPEGEGTGT
ncbi:MAG: methyltransferase domain-containing protein [Actinomycetota bacterium]